MALNSEVVFDNRIPPKGFTNARLNEFQSPVVGATYADGQHFDITTYNIPANTTKIVANLFYQTASKEYIEFLRDANYTNTKGQDIYNLWMAHGKSAPELMGTATWSSVAQNVVMNPVILSVTRTTDKKGVSTGQATVLVSNDGAPVAGATVTASYTGPTTGTVSGSTGTDGKVVLKTKAIKTSSGVWCFTVTNVAKSGFTYDGTKPNLCEGTTRQMITATGDKPNAGVQVYPNPFTERLFFSVSTPDTRQVMIELFDMSGIRVATVYNARVEAGSNFVIGYTPKLAMRGTYVYRVTMGDKRFTGRVLYR
jgi:hypothetical protein